MTAMMGVAQTQTPIYEEPPEEDEDLTKVIEYSFNPLQADKELKVGQFYMKKGSYQAAAGRFEEATKWNPRLAEAYFRLGEALEKQAQTGKDGEQPSLVVPEEIAKQAETEKTNEQKEPVIERALEAYKKYLELEPNGRHAKSLRKKVAKLGSS